MQATGSRAEEPTATGGVPPPLWSPCLLVLFSSSVSHIHWGCLGRGWEKMKFKGTNNKVASAALSLLSGCVGKVCVGAGGPPATGLGQGVPARPAE